MTSENSALLAELSQIRERYVDDAVLAVCGRYCSRTQIDDAAIAARIRWDQRHPAAARAMKCGDAALLGAGTAEETNR